ncbi:olfactory receptor class A-like protein 1 [Rhinophrynus dorsalis]
MEILPLLKAFGFIILIIIGMPGNVFILLKFTYIKLIEKKLLPNNMILMVLALANILMIFSRVIPQAQDAMGVKNLLDDIECKLVLFTYRVSRAMSICITSFLSCHQCVLIAPVTKMWIYVKKLLAQNVLAIILIIFVMNVAFYGSCFYLAKAKSNSTTSIYTLNLVYCNADFLTYMSFMIFGAISVIREVIFVGLMTLSSSYIVFVLHQHGKAIKGMRSSDKGLRKTVEYKASRAVIVLVALYVVLYGMDNAMWIYTLTLTNMSPEMNNLRIFLAASYSAFSPLVIIATNPKLHHSLKNALGKQSPKTEKQSVQKTKCSSCVSQT